MSAIDNTFHFVRNPTAINGLQTTYVSKRGSDVSGDGTAQNPYASIAKATSVATTRTNIMLDDGEYNEARTANNRVFNWWGNGKTIIVNNSASLRETQNYNFIVFKNPTIGHDGHFCYNNCILLGGTKASTVNADKHYNCILIDTPICASYYVGLEDFFSHCVIIRISFNINIGKYNILDNCVLINFTISSYSLQSNSNNFTNASISLADTNSINNETTGQTLADYFNYVHPNVLANPTTATIDDWLQCDFTAKAGSKNIGAGEKGSTIGLNEGFTMYADNSANDVFKESNGATLKNIAWDNTLNGYVLVQKDRVCQGATSNTITLDSSASPVDDYYNNLFVGIVGGDGYGELFLITDYDGATKTATIDGTWNTTPTTNSIYTISGTILSAVKDLGKAIKVKRNWTFADNFTALQDGQWAEFMTHVETNGKQLPVSCYSYEYSTDGVNFIQGQTADDLVSATNGENKVTDNIYGDCSPNYDEATAKNLVIRYIRVRVHIGFNI